MTTVLRVFKVDGRPFFPVADRPIIPAVFNDRESETAFKATKTARWEYAGNPRLLVEIEPVEGRFDFTSVDALLASARYYDVKLILLWFATWKNGKMDYTPVWVKTDLTAFLKGRSRRTAKICGRFLLTARQTSKRIKSIRRVLPPSERQRWC